MKAMALEDNGWPEEALNTIIGLSRIHQVFTADDLTREMRKPPHPNMAGQAFSTARSLKYIEPVGYRTSTTPSRKHGVLRTWKRRINEGVAE